MCIPNLGLYPSLVFNSICSLAISFFISLTPQKQKSFWNENFNLWSGEGRLTGISCKNARGFSGSPQLSAWHWHERPLQLNTACPQSPASQHFPSSLSSLLSTSIQATPTESSKPELQKKATVKASAGQGQRRLPTPSARVQHLHRQDGLVGSKWSPGVLAHQLYNHQLWLYMNELMAHGKTLCWVI